MKKIFFTAIICLIYGCAAGPLPIKQFVSPSQADYDRAEELFQQQKYSQAIAAYEKFIEDYPQSNLAAGAYLGIGWSRYLRGEYKEALDALSKARIQDKSLRNWVLKLQEECKKRMAKEEGVTPPPSIFNIPAFTNQDKLRVEGVLVDGARVIINDAPATALNGVFFSEVPLREGENTITVAITDKDGKTETKQTKVVLDKVMPVIKVTSAELDDFGYVQLNGQTKAKAELTAEGEMLTVNADGTFSGRIKSPRNKQIKLVATDRAGNSATEVFYDNDYPDRPEGLRLRNQSGVNAEIQWNDNREDDLKGYNVYYSLAGEFSDKRNNREIITDNYYSLSDLRTAKTYQVYVRAVDKMGNESDPSTQTLTITIP